ncbi:MAG: STT3 domain-containing protein [Candidatus Auribacterota bacterium]
MAGRQISEKQKQFILENASRLSVDELAKHLNLNAKDVLSVLNETQQTTKTELVEYPAPQYIVSLRNILCSKVILYPLLAFGMLMLFFFGYYWRMHPERTLESIMLDYDYAFHLRMTESILETGTVPETDPMGWYPDGKPVRELLPVFLYHLGAIFHKHTTSFTGRSVQDSIMLFYGIFCSLCIIPIFLLLKQITKRYDIAFIGTALAAVMPANIVRTFCTRYRYEGPGVIFLLFNMFFFMKAVEARSRKSTLIYGAVASIFMMLAVGTWRVSLLFPTLYCCVFIVVIILRRVNTQFLAVFSLQSLGVVFCALFYTYLNSQNYIFSHNAMLITGLGITALCTQWWKKEGVIRVEPVFFLIPLAMVLIVPMLHLSSGYESFFKVLLLKIRFSIQKFQVTGIENILFMNTAELSSVKPLDLFKWDMCSWGAIFIIFYPITLLIMRDKNKKVPFGEILILVFFSIIIFLTLLFYRNKVLLSPFVGLAGALSVHRTLLFIRRFRNWPAVAGIAFLAATVIIAGSGWRTGKYISVLRVSMRSYLEPTIINLEKINKDRVPVLAYWSYGYVIQTYAHSPTFLDGLLESPVVHGRLVEMSNLLLQNDEELFYQFCKKYGMGIMMVDKYDSRTQLYTLYAEKPYFQYFQRGGRPTEFGKNCIRSKTIFDPKSLKHFKLVYMNPRFNIFIIE